MARFPVDKIPDKDVFAPHHIYVGLLVTWFGFMFIWPYYPVTGAVSVLVGMAIALDDVVSHVFGWPTPIDYVWNRWVGPKMP